MIPKNKRYFKVELPAEIKELPSSPATFTAAFARIGQGTDSKRLGVKGAVLLSHLADSSKKSDDGWIHSTAEDFHSATGLTYGEQKHALDQLQKRGLVKIETRSE